MSALVIGANGYIGFSVAQILRQNGYKVHGLVRKQEYARKLASHEIIPLIGDASNPSTYQDTIKHVDVIIESTSDTKSHGTVLETVKKVSSSLSFGKKIYIFTSGVLVHGEIDGVVTSEDQLNTPEPLKKREKFESDVINSKDIHGIVIRPGFLYGYAGGNGGVNLENVYQLNNGKIEIEGRLDKIWPWVHVYDLARAYLLAIQKFTVASGQVFNIATRDIFTYEEVRKRAAEIAGHKDAPVVQLPLVERHPFVKLFETQLRISPKKAENLLGWFPTHDHMLYDLSNDYLAYQALQNQK